MEYEKNSMDHIKTCKGKICSSAQQLLQNFKSGDRDEVYLLKVTNDLLTLVRRGKEPDSDCKNSLPHCLIYMLWINASKVKLIRKLVQILMSMEKLCHDNVDEALSVLWRRIYDNVWSQQPITEAHASVNQLSNRSIYLFLLCNVLEGIKFSPSFLNRDIVTQIIQYSCTELVRECTCTEAWTVVRQRRMYMINKILFQFCQMMIEMNNDWCAALHQTTIEELLVPDYDCSDSAQSLPVKCLQAALCVLKTEKSPKDCQLLAGSTISFLLTSPILSLPQAASSSPDSVPHSSPTSTSCPDDTMTALCQLFLLIFHSLSTGGDSGLNPPGSTSLFTELIEKSRNEFSSFGHLSLVNGLMSYAPTQFLLLPFIERLDGEPDNIKMKQVVCSTNLSTAGECSSHSRDGDSHKILSNSADGDGEVRKLLNWCLDITVQLCSTSHHKYHSFKLLELYYKRLSRDHKLLPYIRGARLLDGTSSLRRTLRLLLTNVDSPVDGVDGSSMAVLTLLLQHQSVVINPSDQRGSAVEDDDNVEDMEFQFSHLHSSSAMETEHTLNESHSQLENSTDELELVDWLLTDLSAMAWHVRARYLLWAIFIPHMPLDKLLECCKDLIEDISRCLTTNYLTPPALQVYQQIISKLMSEKNALELWKTYCWSSLKKALHNPTDSLLCRNASQQWLIGTLKSWPATLTLMLDDLSSLSDPTESSQLYAALVVMCAARSCHIDSNVKPKLDWLERAIKDSDNNLRLIGFSYICISARKTEYISPEYLSLLRRSLPHNMNIDVPAFRKQLQACLLSALVRSRDASLAELRITARRTGKQSGKDLKNLSEFVDQKSVAAEWTRMADDSVEKSDESSAELISSLEFIDWCWVQCMHTLVPGCNYQSLYTALLWARTVIDTCEPRPHQSLRKGCVPGDIGLLIEAARVRGLCQFFTPLAFNNLLSCLLHTIDEIREMSADILMLYFPWTAAASSIGCLRGHDDLVTSQSLNRITDLLSAALSLCNSTRADECDSGALILSIIFNKCIIEQGWSFRVTLQTSDSSIDKSLRFKVEPSSATETGLLPAASFITDMLSLVKSGIALAKENTLLAAQQQPMHGFLLAVRRCLIVIGSSVIKSADQSLKGIIDEIKELTTQVFRTSLKVFGGVLDWNDKVAAPSFERMGECIRDAITASLEALSPQNGRDYQSSGKGEGRGRSIENMTTDEAVLTTEYQQVSTWCWLNLREGSLLLGHMADVFLRCDTAHSNDSLLSYSCAEEIGQLFLKVLTGCRHRGAIESCSVGFDLYCAALMRHSDINMNRLPEKILHQVFGLIERSTDLSVTRRAAGFPLIVQAILGNESKLKQSTLLKQAVEHFLSILSQSVTLNLDILPHTSQGQGHSSSSSSALAHSSNEMKRQQHDIPQVHCLHMLKALVHDAGLSGEVGVYVEPLTMSAIDGFTSAEWAIRNANIHLLGALLSKLLGEKKTRAEDILTMTAGEFCAQYPALSQHMLSVINHAALQLVDEASNNTNLANRIPSASLFPVLVILSRLTPGMELAESEKWLSAVRQSVGSLAQSSLFAVRQLGAKALVPLIPRHCAVDFALTTALNLPKSKQAMKAWLTEGKGVGFNQLHGELLQIEQLIHSVDDSSCSMSSIRSSLTELLQALDECSWILSADNPCHLVSFTFLRLYARVLKLSESSVRSEVESLVELTLRGDTEKIMQAFEIGDSSYLEVCTSFWMDIAWQRCKSRGKVCNQTSVDQVHTSENTICMSLDQLKVSDVSLNADQDKAEHTELTNRLVVCLSHQNSVVVISSLEWLTSHLSKDVANYITWEEVEPVLWSLALCDKKQWREQICTALDLLFLIHKDTSDRNRSMLHGLQRLKLYSADNADKDEGLITVWNRLISLIGGDFNVSASTAALKLSAVMLRDAIASNSSLVSYIDISEWLNRLYDAADIHQMATMRISAALSVQVATDKLLLYIQSSSVLRLMKLILRQLYDEEVIVRQAACETILILTNHSSSKPVNQCHIHFNYATKLLLDYIMDTWGDEEKFGEEIYGWFICSNDQDSLSLLTNSRRPELFEAEDVNPFYELNRFHVCVVNCLLRMRCKVESDWLMNEAKVLTGLINNTSTLLQSNNNGWLIASSNKMIYEFLHSLLCRHVVISDWLRELAQRQDVKELAQCQVQSGVPKCLHSLSESFNSFNKTEFMVQSNMLESFEHKRSLDSGLSSH